MSSAAARPTSVVAGILLLLVLVVGVGLRAAEIAQTRALGAEDPYSHVVFTREALERGRFEDSWYLGTEMYPPGLHALLGTLSSLSGFSALELARWLPLALGALAIVGTYALAVRLGGAPAGLTAALLVAVMPEHVFRTQLLFPTALDLALLPAWLLLFHEAIRPAPYRPRLAAALLFVASAVPLAWMHPWVVPLFCVPALGYAFLRVVRTTKDPLVAVGRSARPVVLTALTSAFAIASRWDVSDTGFRGFLAGMGPLSRFAAYDPAPPKLFLLAFMGIAAAGFFAVVVVAILAAIPLPRMLRTVGGLAVATALVVVAWTWTTTNALPRDVSYVHMLGAVALGLTTAGVFAAFLRPSPLGDLGLSIVVVLGPLTALDVFGSPFWPQRTVAYVTLGAALLGGWVMGAASTSVLRAWPRRSAAALPAAAVAVVLLVAGSSLAMPAKTYDWYRMYDEDDHAALERVVEIVEPGSRIFVQTWQPALVLRSVGELDTVWYSPTFFKDGGKRAEQLSQTHGEAYVIVDKHTRKQAEKGEASLTFLAHEPVVLRSMDGGLVVHRMEGRR